MLSHRFLRTAAVFFALGVGLGMYMGIAKDFRFTHVHAHVNLLGWVALGIAGLIYAQHPRLAAGWAGHAHYWLHTVGLVVFMGAFAWGAATGTFLLGPVSVGATLVAAGVAIFVVNVCVRLRHA